MQLLHQFDQVIRVIIKCITTALLHHKCSCTQLLSNSNAGCMFNYKMSLFQTALLTRTSLCGIFFVEKSFASIN